jgi:hypothetical protein
LDAIRPIPFEYQLVDDNLTNMKTPWSIIKGFSVKVSLEIPKDKYKLEEYSKKLEKNQFFEIKNLNNDLTLADREMADNEIELEPDMSLQGSFILPDLKLSFRPPKEISHLDLSRMDYIEFYCPGRTKKCYFLPYFYDPDYIPTKPMRKCLAATRNPTYRECMLKYSIGDLEKVFITELDDQRMIYWLVSKKGKWHECIVYSKHQSKMNCDYTIKSGPLYFEEKGVKIYDSKIYELIPTKLEDNHFLVIIPCIGRTNQCFKRNFYYFSRPSLSQKLPLEFIKFPIYIGEIKSYNFVNNTMRLGLIPLLPLAFSADIVMLIRDIPAFIRFYLYLLYACGGKRC